MKHPEPESQPAREVCPTCGGRTSKAQTIERFAVGASVRHLRTGKLGHLRGLPVWRVEWSDGTFTDDGEEGLMVVRAGEVPRPSEDTNKTPDACPGATGFKGDEHTAHASRGAGPDRQRDTGDGGERPAPCPADAKCTKCPMCFATEPCQASACEHPERGIGTRACGDGNVDGTTCILVKGHDRNHYDGIGYWAGFRRTEAPVEAKCRCDERQPGVLLHFDDCPMRPVETGAAVLTTERRRNEATVTPFESMMGEVVEWWAEDVASAVIEGVSKETIARLLSKAYRDGRRSAEEDRRERATPHEKIIEALGWKRVVETAERHVDANRASLAHGRASASLVELEKAVRAMPSSRATRKDG